MLFVVHALDRPNGLDNRMKNYRDHRAHLDRAEFVAAGGPLAVGLPARVALDDPAVPPLDQALAGLPAAGGLPEVARRKSLLLLGLDANLDLANPHLIEGKKFIVNLTSFKSGLGDVLLPIAPFTETPGTFVSAEGRVQSFHAVVKPQGEARPAWKVLRVLGNLLDVPGFNFETSQDVLAKVTAQPIALSNAIRAEVRLGGAVSEPVVAPIYQLDGIVRRAASLQQTADARKEVA